MKRTATAVHQATQPRRCRPHTLVLGLLGLWCGTSPVPTLAALLEISNVPLRPSMVEVKPNLMFILDDSGSMGYDFMPDDLVPTYQRDDPVAKTTIYGFLSSHCNGLAFNPALSYTPPLRSDGSSYPNASLTAAPSNGFDPNSQLLDLSSHYYYVYKGNVPQALAWTYQANGQPNTRTTFYNECTLNTATAPNSTLFVRTGVNSLDAVGKQRYANWYAYYRTRRNLMRTAVGQAFGRLNDSYRVGLTAISDDTVTSPSFLDIADYSRNQRQRFYELLYSKETQYGFTPLRGALSKVGRYFANKASGQRSDPVQYSCQRNYALLSTDGYWNTGMAGYEGLETDTYGPLKLDGISLVGSQDANEARPMKDGTGSASGGDSNALADVAQYYWKTDLRPELNNNVPPTDRDTATHQHLNTFAIGLGVQGTLSYDRNYLNQTLGDFADIVKGTRNWPIPAGTISGDVNNTANATHIDDLWHAAVNGRGQFFSALNAQALTEALSTTLYDISKDLGSGSAAASSSLTPVEGDNWVFLPSYSNSPTWHGDIKAFQFSVDASTGSLVAPDTSDGKQIWSAATRLDLRTAPRRLLFANTQKQLVDFTFSNLQKTGYAGDFDSLCPSKLSQCAGLNTAALGKATGENLVRFLAGETSLQMNVATSADSQVFRARTSRLGDFINAAPVYVAKPPFHYADPGYASFAAAQAQRQPVVYAPANDGLLHAFAVGQGSGDTNGGQELWAFVPHGVLPHLWKLADTNYDFQHLNLLDATPVIGDIYDGTRWRSILVSGLGGGGRYYYALDITDPLAPSLLWEFSDDNLGLTYASPVITKDQSGQWVVAFTSGLNNVGDGQGRLYVLNASTGALLREIKTYDNNGQPVGNRTTPNNMGHLNAWVANDTDNTALRFYAGDMLGNLWRFDIDDVAAPAGREALLLGRALAPDGSAQPITTKPVLSEIQYNGMTVATVSFGTGRLANTTDLRDTTVQSIYSVRDSLSAQGLGNLRSSAAKLVTQPLNANRQTAAPLEVDWTLQNGWYVDLDRSSGERVLLNGAPLGSGLLAFASMLPSSDPCGSGNGQSYLYQFLLTSGEVKAVDMSDSQIVGINRVMDSTGRVSAFFTTRNQATRLKASGSGLRSRSNQLRRAAWRELN